MSIIDKPLEPMKKPERPDFPKLTWDHDQMQHCESCDAYRLLNAVDGQELCASCITSFMGMEWERYTKELEVYLDQILAAGGDVMYKVGVIGGTSVYTKAVT